MTIDERIRQIFLQPQAVYGVAEAATLLEYSDGQMLRAIAEGDIAFEAGGVGMLPRIPWQEVAVCAVERWQQQVIEAALGEELSSVMPELVRLTELSVRVPRFGVVALGRVAQREGTTIDEIIAKQLLDLAASEADELQNSVVGLSSALRWPLP